MLQIEGPERGGRGGRSSWEAAAEVEERRGSCLTQEVWLEEGDQEEEAGSSFRFRAKGAAEGIGDGQAEGVDEGGVVAAACCADERCVVEQ